MAIITNELTSTDYKVFEYVTNDPTGWVEGAIISRLAIAKSEILTALMQHCNENEIALAVGEEAQINQAFELDVALTVTERNALSDLS
jgi:hypothetical protein